MPSSLFHLVDPRAWQVCRGEKGYEPTSLSLEGFIHLSTRAQVEATAHRFYADREELLVVEVDTEKLRSELRYEAAEGQSFPHLYGALNLDAVIRVEAMTRDALGEYRLPARF